MRSGDEGSLGDGTVLIVRHGPGRGRLPAYFQPFLDDLARRAPGLGRRVRHHRTGDGAVGLDGVRAVVFWLADPLAELYPACYEEAEAIAAEAAAAGAEIVNPPANLSHSVKSTQARLWHDAGIPTPQQLRFDDDAELDVLLGTVPFPAIVRSDLLHAQEGMAWCGSPDDARRLARDGALTYPGSLTPFVDTREGYREARPGTIWASLFHKKRALVFGDDVRNHSILFSASPIVAGPGSTFDRCESRTLRWAAAKVPGRGRSGLTRWVAVRDQVALRVHPWGRDSLAEDLAYWEAGREHGGLLRRAAGALGLQFLAVDYSSRADGSVVLWEANPAFVIHMAWPMPAVRRQGDRLASYHAALAAFLTSLLDPDRVRLPPS